MSKRTPDTDVFDRVQDVDDTVVGDDAEVVGDKAGASTEIPASADTAVTTETSSAGSSLGRRVAFLRQIPPKLAVLVVLVALWLAGTLFLGWHVLQRHRIDSAAAEALSAANSYAVLVTTMDYQNVDQVMSRTLDGATGQFKDDYSQGAKQLRQLLIDNKSKSVGIVVESAVKWATTGRAEVLLFVDQSITNAANPSPRIDRNRVDMVLDHVGNRWLVSKVELL